MFNNNVPMELYENTSQYNKCYISKLWNLANKNKVLHFPVLNKKLWFVRYTCLSDFSRTYAALYVFPEKFKIEIVRPFA